MSWTITIRHPRSRQLLQGCVFGLTLLIGTCAFCQMSADFYVAPDGNDTWSGRRASPSPQGDDGPLASLTRAQEVVREQRDAEGEAGPIVVMLRGGTYSLTSPWLFTPADSGSEARPITWAAYPGETPVISGGRRITAWREEEPGLWVADVPEAATGEWFFRQVFVNGERRIRCRTPNVGTFRSAGPLSPRPARNTPGWSDPECRIGLHYSDGDLQPWPDLKEGSAIVFQSWTASVHWLDSIDPVSKTVRFTAGSGWPMGYWEKNQRYYIEHVRAALDAPGEWFLDCPAGKLYTIPLPGETLRDFEVTAPVAQALLELKGDTAAGVYVEHLTFRGLSFQYSAFSLPRTKAHDGQAAVSLGAAVTTSATAHCRFDSIEVAHVGTYGFGFGAATQDCLLTTSEIHDLGAGGVRIGTTGNEDEASACRTNSVENCFIHDGGHIAKAGIGVWIGRSSHNHVMHNDICDFDYTGISVGWSWGYAPSSAHHNIVEYNHIHHIGNGMLSDMGGIYCLGLSPGTILRGNVMHDISSYGYGGWGLYTDEGSTDILMEKNVVYNTKSGGFHQHYGKNNILRHNIFAFSQEGQIIRSREEEHTSFTLERNIVIFDNGQPLGGNWGNGNVELDHNIYWDTTGQPFDFSGYTFEEWRNEKGKDQHSIIQDPLFLDPHAGDFRLGPGSPVTALGIEPLGDPSQAGLQGPRSWVERPRNVMHRSPNPDRLPPSKPTRTKRLRQISDSFEATAVGEPAVDAQTGEAGQGTIRVSAERGAGGSKHSLKFTDADDLEHEWQPHTNYKLNWPTGTATASFDVFLEAGARFWHEWRQYNGDYVVGPEIRFQEDGSLTSGGNVLMTYPTETWIHVQITCPLGEAAAKGFDLVVTVEGQPARSFTALPLGSPKWHSLTWIGLISEASQRSVFFIDNLEVQRQKAK